MFQDKNAKCRDCGLEFIFSIAEQEAFAEKGHTNVPGRCPACRAVRKQSVNRDNNNNSNYSQNRRELHPAICSTCGQETSVPFVPSPNKPVYCRVCYQKTSSHRKASSYQ